jgi:hypothetical protein
LIEGEGSFSGTGIGSQGHGVTVGQKDPECLQRLQALFGGAIYERSVNNASFYTWDTTGVLARSIMMTLFSLLTKRRQLQITRCLSAWKVRRTKFGKYSALNTHCKRGHAYTPETVRMTVKGSRECLLCTKLKMKQLAVNRKQARHAKRLQNTKKGSPTIEQYDNSQLTLLTMIVS